MQKDGVLSSGEAELFLISPEDKGPVLRAELTDKKNTVQKGAVVSIPVDQWMRVESKVTATGLTKTGVPYADIKIPDDLSYRVSNLFKDSEEIKMKATVRAKENTTLIPVAAVRGSGETAMYLSVKCSSPCSAIPATKWKGWSSGCWARMTNMSRQTAVS